MLKILRFFAVFLLILSFSGCKFVQNDTEPALDQNERIPKAAIDTWQFIKTYNRAPKGFVGGRKFRNSEKLLPQKDDSGEKITYREWDIHPKVAGKNRGAERLVTGSDGRVWYTNDHYHSFNELILSP